MRGRLILVTLLAILVNVSCRKPSGTQPAPSASVTLPVVANDGTDPHVPVLSPDDVTLVDARHGRDWDERCWNEERQGKYGWAMACCRKALDVPELDESVKASLLYTEGMAMEGAGDMSSARDLYERSLAFGSPPDPGERGVQAAIARVSRPLTDRSRPVSFPCGRFRCATGQLCCGGVKCVASVFERDSDCFGYPMMPACDPTTHEPCDNNERCAVDPVLGQSRCMLGHREAGAGASP